MAFNWLTTSRARSPTGHAPHEAAAVSAPSLQQLQAAWAGGWTEGSWRTVVAGPTCQQGQNRLPCPMVCGHVQ
eukprot:SAG25_NODE_9250_length_381_cov_0.666667_1_plen_72_part_10